MVNKKLNSNHKKSADAEKVGNKFTYLILSIIGLLTGIVLAISLSREDLGQGMITHPPTAIMDGQLEGEKQLNEQTKNRAENQLPNAEISLPLKDPIEDIKAAFGDREALNILPPPELFPRPDSEWQGMLVDLSMQSICDGESSCGLAMACKNNRCGACQTDSDCESNEACVIDHCVVNQNVECRSATDCSDGELCMLSGYSEGLRGNETMQAYCQLATSGIQPTQEQGIEQTTEEPGPYTEERPVSLDQLHETLLQHQNTQVGTVDTVDTDRPVSKSNIPEQVDEESRKFEQQDDVDTVDPQEEHIKVEEESEEPNM